jgi:hypothetical protein
MREKMRPELVPPRIVSAPAGTAPADYRPWVEVAALVRVSFAGWDSSDEAWVHWAVPVIEGILDLNGAVSFDPGRRAAFPGEPPVELQRGEATLDEPGASSLGEALLSQWEREVHYHPVLRLASRLDEPSEAFRRRCVALATQAVPRREGSAWDPKEATRLAAAIESRVLTGEALEVRHWRVGVGWYPAGVEPAPAPGDPLMHDGPGAGA